MYSWSFDHRILLLCACANHILVEQKARLWSVGGGKNKMKSTAYAHGCAMELFNVGENCNHWLEKKNNLFVFCWKIIQSCSARFKLAEELGRLWITKAPLVVSLLRFFIFYSKIPTKRSSGDHGVAIWLLDEMTELEYEACWLKIGYIA